MGSIAFLGDDTFQLHLNPELHPESPDRLVAINQAIRASDLKEHLVNLDARFATPEELCAVHATKYIEALEKANEKVHEDDRIVQLDPDTFMSAGTFKAAQLAAGASLVAVEAMESEDFVTAFVAARPPGHHALVDRQMGFCIFNNVALAARHARQHLGYGRVLIIDWDVHHGNGTQAIFYDDPSVCFLSLHQFPLWPPDSGWFSEDGVAEGKGYNINIPLPAGTGDVGYLAAWDKIVMPLTLEYQPELILLSAGYDAHQLDPRGQQQITTTGYAILSQKLFDLSQMTKAKIACFLEGGYNKKALAESVVATLRVLSVDSIQRLAEVQNSYIVPGDASLKPVTNDQNPGLTRDRIESVCKHFAQYWTSLR